MLHVAVLLIGFSVFYGLVFISTHFKDSYYDEQKISKIFGIMLILSLMGLQLAHYFYLTQDSIFIFTPIYLILLYLVAPSFYFYSRSLLKAENHFKWLHALHFAPLAIPFFLPQHHAFVLAFVIGSGYLLWLLKTIHALRQYKDQFKSEMLLLMMVFIVAIIVSIIALIMPFDKKLFYALYASAIGFALLMVALVVSYKPKISKSVSDVAIQTYAVSTLRAVDCDDKLKQLTALMNNERLYQQSNLDLQTIALELDLTTHQLSELINSKLCKSFSRYLREQRINAAKQLLIDQPTASVLSIALEVGFSSQSNFYEAFKELTSTTPAKFRKLPNKFPE